MNNDTEPLSLLARTRLCLKRATPAPVLALPGQVLYQAFVWGHSFSLPGTDPPTNGFIFPVIVAAWSVPRAEAAALRKTIRFWRSRGFHRLATPPLPTIFVHDMGSIPGLLVFRSHTGFIYIADSDGNGWKGADDESEDDHGAA